MKTKPTTIKDIARVCNVSAAVVSAALRGIDSNISCSESTKKKILETARRLKYRPNFIARAMVSGVSKIIAYCLHSTIEDMVPSYLNYYLHDNLPLMTFNLNKRGFEVLFIPYSNQAEQLERLRSLADSGVISGVITNIIPDSHKEIISFLKGAGIPYVIKGYDLDNSIHSAFKSDRLSWEIIQQYSDSKGFKSIFHAGIFRGSLILNKFPFPGTSHFSAPVISENALNFQDKEILFTAFGYNVAELLMRKKKCPSRNIFLVEDARNKYSSDKLTTLFVNSVPSTRKMLDYCADSVSSWVAEKIIPEIGPHEFLIEKKDMNIREAQ